MASELASGFAPTGENGWRAQASKALKGASLDALWFETLDNIRLAPVHPAREAAMPIGGRPASRPWRVTERLDDPDPGRGNGQALDALANGATALSIVVRGAPSAHGYGIADDGDALGQTLEKVALDAVALRFEPHPGAAETAQRFSELPSLHAIDPAALDVSFGLDPLGNLARYGQSSRTWPETVEILRSTRQVLIEQGLFGPVAEADGRVYHEAGASNAQELAAVLSTALAYLRVLSPDRSSAQAAACIGFTLAVDQTPFESIAKLRALRLLWRRLLEILEADAPSPARLHAETSWRMMTATDAHTNMLRVVISAFAAGAGGADSLAVLPYSAALGLPESDARRLARNVQLLLLEETNLHRVTDPAAGAGGLEALTDGLCAKAWEIFQEIEADGGIVESLIKGRLQDRIEGTAGRVRRDVTAGDRAIIGVTAHPDPAPGHVPLAQADPWPPMRFDAPALRCRALTPVRWEEWVERR